MFLPFPKTSLVKFIIANRKLIIRIGFYLFLIHRAMNGKAKDTIVHDYDAHHA